MSSRRGNEIEDGGFLHDAQAIGANSNGKTLVKGKGPRVFIGIWMSGTTAGQYEHVIEVTTNAQYLRLRWDEGVPAMYVEGSAAGGRWSTLETQAIVKGGNTTISAECNMTGTGR